jgi:hypothetical protein
LKNIIDTNENKLQLTKVYRMQQKQHRGEKRERGTL